MLYFIIHFYLIQGSQPFGDTNPPNLADSVFQDNCKDDTQICDNSVPYF